MDHRPPSRLRIFAPLIAHFLLAGCALPQTEAPTFDGPIVQKLFTSNPDCKVDDAPGNGADVIAIAYAKSLSKACFIRPDPQLVIAAGKLAGPGVPHGRMIAGENKLYLLRGPNRMAKKAGQATSAQAARRAKSFKASKNRLFGVVVKTDRRSGATERGATRFKSFSGPIVTAG